ncbi:hypothetical protein LOK49_LG03G03412 [Camellia lanceoleosa]|uniref:Uncharacterized protein n=1 Tax=Camellia lanceoleosa TaxID=1840588 RepID=A0ACC0I8K6_9ERIC|nr:hypothetical protein LOK49_LG03G03412 [Camellia lanceoleosa]
MREMSYEEHDRLAARSQFLTHTIGRILSEMEIESTSIDTKNFQSLVKLKESTITDSFDLFSGLFINNKFSQQEGTYIMIEGSIDQGSGVQRRVDANITYANEKGDVQVRYRAAQQERDREAA